MINLVDLIFIHRGLLSKEQCDEIITEYHESPSKEVNECCPHAFTGQNIYSPNTVKGARIGTDVFNLIHNSIETVINEYHEYMDKSISIMQSWGLNVVLGSTIYDSHGHFSSTDNNREKDFQNAIDDNKINGSNNIEILSKLNFASPYIELPKKLTVRQNLEIYARLYGVKDINTRIEEISEDLNLNNFIDKKNGELSSGQKNRVSLAKSLINKPKILFLDEPTASLDPDIGDFVRNYIENYKRKNELTILLASHNMSEVERLCDKIVMMKEGSIVDRGSCKELISKHGRNNLEEVFLKLTRNSNEF